MGKKKSIFDSKPKKRDRDDHRVDKRHKNKEKKIRTFHHDLSIGKDDRMKMRKLAEKPVEVPKENQEIRNSCNHQTTTISIDEFDQRGYSRNIVPMLDMMVKVFGKNNVGICSACYDVVVGDDAITIDAVTKAVCVLYAAANYVVANGDIKQKEIRAIADTKNTMLTDWQMILARYRDISQYDRSSESNDADGSNTDVSKLNGVNIAY